MLPREGHDLSCSLCTIADIEGRFNVPQCGFEGGIRWIDINAIRKSLDREAIA
jgi:hypothetical protein